MKRVVGRGGGRLGRFSSKLLNSVFVFLEMYTVNACVHVHEYHAVLFWFLGSCDNKFASYLGTEAFAGAAVFGVGACCALSERTSAFICGRLAYVISVQVHLSIVFFAEQLYWSSLFNVRLSQLVTDVLHHLNK